MKLENQVVSLELAKKLKELGVEQQSLFWWVADIEKLMHEKGEDIVPERCRCRHSIAELPIDTGEKFHPEIDLRFYGGAKPVGRETYAAFTVAELGEILPFVIDEDEEEGGYYFVCDKAHKVWHCAYQDMHGLFYSDDDMNELRKTADTEADARAKMLIYLIENGLTNLTGVE